MIKAICFDLDGVYFTAAGIHNFIDELVKLGASKENAEFAVFKSPEMKNFKKGEISEEEYWNYIRTFLGINKSVQEFRDLLVSGYEINQEVHQSVLKAKQNGYKTCICSNNFVSRVEALENKFGFLKDFDSIIFSYKVGVLKPEKRIFEELIKEANVLSQELVYSDDSPEKLAGAIELGINAFVYENFDLF